MLLFTNIYLDIFLCLSTYLILLGIIFWHKRKGGQSGDTNDDGNGGLPVDNGPKLDLPPGVCLPGEGPSIKLQETYEELLA